MSFEEKVLLTDTKTQNHPEINLVHILIASLLSVHILRLDGILVNTCHYSQLLWTQTTLEFCFMLHHCFR